MQAWLGKDQIRILYRVLPEKIVIENGDSVIMGACENNQS